jgi:asparagine synthase (glutamine-hydrolysing)
MTPRLLAGIAGPGAGERLTALAPAFAGADGPCTIERLGERLAILVAGPDPERPRPQRGRRCLLEGSLFNAEQLGLELGLDPRVGLEVLLDAAYERHGTDLPGRLRGEFVLLIHDPEAELLLLACDQLGARSAFFAASTEELRFATEVRLLLPLLPTRPAPDEAALVQWLAESALGEGRTLYRGVERLCGGRALLARRGRTDVQRYWRPRYAEPAAISRTEAADAAREKMEAAVRQRLPADPGRVGVLLSGGLDSSSVAALAKRGGAPSGTVHAYSAVFPDHDSIDESELIEEVAGTLGLQRTSVAVRGGSMLRGALEYQRRWELPLPAPNHFLWQPLLERAAADGNAEMFDGEGGDELWRFSPYLIADLLRAGRVPGALRTTREMLGEELFRGWRPALPYLRTYGVKGAIPPGLHRSFRRLHSPQRYAPPWLTPRSAAVLFEQRDAWDWKRLEGPRWWAFLADLLTGVRERLGVGDYMRHRAQMAGLRSRHPLIDLELVEFALGLPPQLAIDPRLERPVVRDAMAGLIPDSIRLRPGKSYFTALFRDCLAGRDLELIRELLGGQAEVGAYVDLGAVRRELLGDRRPATWPWAVWRLVTAECWLRSQGDDGFAARTLERCDSEAEDWVLSGAQP